MQRHSTWLKYRHSNQLYALPRGSRLFSTAYNTNKNGPFDPKTRARETVRAALTSFFQPTRADMVAALGELTGEHALRTMAKKMRADLTGDRLISTNSLFSPSFIDIEYLRDLPEGTFGHEYVKYMEKNKFTLFERPPVKYLADRQEDDLIYVMTRYRQVHDFIHTLSGLPPSVLGELAVKWFELVQTELPMTALASIVGPLRLSPSEQLFLGTQLIPWAVQTANNAPFILNVEFEKLWDTPLGELYKELHFHPAPAVPADLSGWAKEYMLRNVVPSPLVDFFHTDKAIHRSLRDAVNVYHSR